MLILHPSCAQHKIHIVLVHSHQFLTYPLRTYLPHAASIIQPHPCALSLPQLANPAHMHDHIINPLINPVHVHWCAG